MTQTLLLLAALSFADFNFATLSIGSWNTYSREGEHNQFDNLKLETYYNFPKTQMYLSIPLVHTIESSEQGQKESTALGDLQSWLSFDSFLGRTRLGLELPLGYSIDKEHAWLGTQNIKLLLGFSINDATLVEKHKFDFLFKIYANNSELFGHADIGSIESINSYKYTFKTKQNWSIPIEILFNSSYMLWSWNDTVSKTIPEYNLNLTPHIGIEHQASNLSYGIKFGIGNSYKSLGTTVNTQEFVLNISSYINIYL